MANHGWLTTKKRFSFEELKEDLAKINHNIFLDSFEVEPYELENGKGGFGLYYRKEEIVNFWMNSSRRLEFRHHHPQWVWWVEYQIQAWLGRKYKGTLTDEGVEGKWRPSLHKYPDIKTYLENTWGPWIKGKALKALLSGGYRQGTPKKLWSRSKEEYERSLKK